MSIILEDKLAENALIAASIAGSKDLVLGLIAAGVKASSTFGAALVVAEFNGHCEVAEILRKQIESEDTRPPNWRDPKFELKN